MHFTGRVPFAQHLESMKNTEKRKKDIEKRQKKKYVKQRASDAVSHSLVVVTVSYPEGHASSPASPSRYVALQTHCAFVPWLSFPRVVFGLQPPQ